MTNQSAQNDKLFAHRKVLSVTPLIDVMCVKCLRLVANYTKLRLRSYRKNYYGPMIQSIS